MASEKLDERVVDAIKAAWASGVILTEADTLRRELSAREIMRSIALVDAGEDQVRANIDLAIAEWKRQAEDNTPHDLTKMSEVGWEEYLHRRIWNHFCVAMAYRENELKSAAPGQPQGETINEDEVVRQFFKQGSSIAQEAINKLKKDYPELLEPDTIPEDEADLTAVYMLGLYDGKKAAAKPDTIPVPADVWKQVVDKFEGCLSELEAWRAGKNTLTGMKNMNEAKVGCCFMWGLRDSRKALAAAKSVGVGS